MADPTLQNRQNLVRYASPALNLRSVGRATTNVIGTAGPWPHSSFIALRFKRENRSGWRPRVSDQIDWTVRGAAPSL